MKMYDRYLENYTKGYFGYNTIALLFQSGLGSAAAMVILQNGTSPAQMIQLFISISVCMLFNGCVLSQRKAKVIVNLLIASVFVNVILIFINTVVI